jgi:hypothetical protein
VSLLFQVRTLLEVIHLADLHLLQQLSMNELNKLCCLFRNAFLADSASTQWSAVCHRRKQLLLLIELFAGSFALQPEASDFYCRE